VKLAHKYGIDMPICEAVHAILSKKADIDETIQSLLERPFASEQLEDVKISA
jgi:glycerol-3-phosphate dehydrogenase (NAD(P)+)